MQPQPTTEVYFYEAVGLGVVKIGFSYNHRSRRAQWQPGTPAPIKFLAAVEGGAKLETALHRRFAEHHVFGEWYRLCPELMGEIDRLAADARKWKQPKDPDRHKRLATAAVAHGLARVATYSNASYVDADIGVVRDDETLLIRGFGGWARVLGVEIARVNGPMPTRADVYDEMIRVISSRTVAKAQL